jgi:hypothetical protein
VPELSQGGHYDKSELGAEGKPIITSKLPVGDQLGETQHVELEATTPAHWSAKDAAELPEGHH